MERMFPDFFAVPAPLQRPEPQKTELLSGSRPSAETSKAWKWKPSPRSFATGAVGKSDSRSMVTESLSTPLQSCPGRNSSETGDEKEMRRSADERSSEARWGVGIPDGKGIIGGQEREGAPDVRSATEEIDHEALTDQFRPTKLTQMCFKRRKEESGNQTAEVVIAMTSLSVDVAGGDGVTADIIDDCEMSQPSNTSPPPPPPFVSDWTARGNAVRQSDRSKPLQLPDVISSHGAEDKLSANKPHEFFCYSSASENFVEICASSDHGGCKKRSALVFPDLMADVGGCLCSRRSLRNQQPTVLPDLFTMLPDLITSHGFLSFETSAKRRMTPGKTILVTGGAGYIGSHSVIELVEAGYDIIVVDNLVNASMESIRRVEKIVGKKIVSYSVDLLDKAALEEVFKKHKVDAVIHFAGLKAVGESCELPLLYYKTNVGGTTNLLEVMEANSVFNLVFSSSATVYGTPQFLPLTEKHPVGGCTNPYGKTKFMIEQMLNDLASANKKWNIVILRYFNPVGAHVSGTIGEDPMGVPNNLMPFIGQVAVGRRAALKVYGSDYDTPDGTGVRDYIHVVDLAQGHVAAVRKLDENCGLKVYNLGTGHGYSVLDMVKAFEKASGKKIPYELVERRPGDVASCYGDPSLATKELHWTAKKGLDEMCVDLWRWQSQNPHGYNVEGKQ